MNTPTPLNESEKERFARQILLPEIGEAGQARLRSKKVLVVGAGGLGSSLLYYLVASGIGEIGIVDFDKVSLSNLQRQILYTEEDLGQSKSLTAQKRLQKLNSHCIIRSFDERFTEENAVQIAQGYDIIVDGCDNLSTRYIMDQVAEQLSLPYLYGAVDSWRGQIALFHYHYKGSGSYRQLFPQKDLHQEKREIPVVGAAVGIISSIMATEVIKTLLDLPDTLTGKLLLFDALTLQYNLLSIQF